jgi:nifR3 family TIM-barrel protein
LTRSLDLIKSLDIETKKIENHTIGSINFNSKLILAPLAGITIRPYRELMTTLGAGGVVTELISCHAINYTNEKTISMMTLGNEATPAIQLFGNDPKVMAKAAIKAEEFNPHYIDINMGCPVRKVVSKGGGAALMKTPLIAAKIINSIKKSVNLPVTIKIRLGADSANINAAELVKIAMEEGAEFVTIHGRTLSQGYGGKANWDIIEDIAAKNSIPVVGNGDLFSRDLILKRLKTTNCIALMLGRGVLKDPFLFLSTIDHNLGIKDYYSLLEFFLNKLQKSNYSERLILTHLKKHAVWYSSGLPASAKFRHNIYTITEINQLMKEVNHFFLENCNKERQIDNESFLTGGHG